jgi:NADPH:quinone reductase-like Zn-dependent oxidoreductase
METSVNPKGYRAYFNQVIILKEQAATQTPAGLIIPNPGNQSGGTVVDIGEGVSGLKLGDWVLWKDTVAVSNNMVVSNSAVFLSSDKNERLVAVGKDQIVVVRSPPS